MATRSTTATLDGPPGLVPNGIALSQKTIAGTFWKDSQHNTCGVRLWDLTTHKVLATTIQDPDTAGAAHLAFSPDGTTLAVDDGNSNTYLWDIT